MLKQLFVYFITLILTVLALHCSIIKVFDLKFANLSYLVENPITEEEDGDDNCLDKVWQLQFIDESHVIRFYNHTVQKNTSNFLSKLWSISSFFNEVNQPPD